MKLTANNIGTHYFDERPVSVTDPCYDRDVWCAIHGLAFKPGNYQCVAWKGSERYKDSEGKMHTDTRVFICGVYLCGFDVRQEAAECTRVGQIGVDAGLAGFFQDKPDYDDDAWDEFCRRIHGKEYLITDEGFATSSGYGDGCYDVFAYYNDDGEIIGAEIRF